MTGVFIVFQHVGVGVGHVTRATALARAFLAHGLGPVTMCFGGPPIAGYRVPDGVRLLQLPAVERVSIESVALRSLDSGVALEHTTAKRGAMPLEACRAASPAALVTEHYPFQPERLAGALDPLPGALRSMRHRLLMLASVRSLSYGPTQARPAQVRQLLSQHYDHVLHHTDPRAFAALPDFRPAWMPDYEGAARSAAIVADRLRHRQA